VILFAFATSSSAAAGRLGKVSRGAGRSRQGGSTPTSGKVARTTLPPEPGEGYGSAHSRRAGHPPHQAHLIAQRPQIDLAVRDEEVTEAPVTVELYVGAQKVVDSDGSLSVDVALVDRWIRLAASVTEYVERGEAAGPMVRVTMPSLTIGARVIDGDRTRLYAEAGWALATTANDAGMDTTIAGVEGGVRLEQLLGRSVALLADARLMAFQADVAAREARIGAQFRYVRASFRVLDLDVGPPLYGPELGVAATF
jgi:hypothetical protein